MGLERLAGRHRPGTWGPPLKKEKKIRKFLLSPAKKKIQNRSISKTKNRTKKVIYCKKKSVRSIPIIPANLAPLNKIEFLGIRNAPFGRPWRPNAI